MAVKCNIVHFALQKLGQLQWGFNCDGDTDKAILENYLEQLACPNVIFVPCYEQDCVSPDIILNCNFNIVSISALKHPPSVDADVIFDLKLKDYAGGTLPFEYSWQYDIDIFDLISPNDNSGKLILKVKPGKTIDTLVTYITLTVVDAIGCSDVKTCYITPDGMFCNNSYDPCNNPINLQVGSIYIPCSKSKNVVVKPV